MDANKAYFMVRSQVTSEADRQKFDYWYATQHVPMAMDRFRCEKGWRFWSRSDPSVHYALYQFADMATLRGRPMRPASRSWSPTSTRRGRRCRDARPDRGRAGGVRSGKASDQ